jgi:hypothetical protein
MSAININNNTKFSDLYLNYYIDKQSFYSTDPKTGEIISRFREYEKYKVIKEFIPNDKKMYYVWGNIAYSIMFDYDCKQNEKLLKLIQLCLMVESKIRKGDIDIVFYDFVNEVLPQLNTLNTDEINMIEKAHRISCGPLFEKLITFTTPHMFIDLFNYSKQN